MAMLPDVKTHHLAQGHSLENSSPHRQDLCNDGTITYRAA